MNQPYFIVVLAHSLHGRIRRFHIDHKVVYGVLALALLGGFTLVGFLASYTRMALKTAGYNALRQETETLRTRYQRLLSESNQTTGQLAQLQLFASEVSVAYGLKKAGEVRPSPAAAPASGSLVPTLTETFEEYNMLKNANLSTFSRGYSRRWLLNAEPTLWPVTGRLLSHYGEREDPFRGSQSFHAGVDISAVMGTPVRVTADGIVVSAEYAGAFGRLIVVDHGRGLQTYYAHLSRFDVIPGQEVRTGQVIGASGASGRVTSPHLHYEVRVGGAPINPYRFLVKSSVAASRPARDFGL